MTANQSEVDTRPLKLGHKLRALASEIRAEADGPAIEPDADSAYEFQDGLAVLRSEFVGLFAEAEDLATVLDRNLQVEVLALLNEAYSYLSDEVDSPLATPQSINEAFRLSYERCDARLCHLAARAFALWSVDVKRPVGGERADTPAEQRNRWIYGEVMKGTPYQAIIQKLAKKPVDWERIYHPQGVAAAAKRFAVAHKLEMPQPRKPGRPKRRINQTQKNF
ncbi:MAG: hypothetical protein ACOX1P_19465 [Thermoguttaceae bacterium]|jgi:hypothetical protein